MKNTRLQLTLLSGLLVASVSASFGQGQNSFFGSALPGNVPSAANPPAGAGGGGGGVPPGGDFSDDEKRMQKKFKASVAHAKELVAKGDTMMKKGESKHDDKAYKKGKILKEIGEKQLNELQANNPFPDKAPKEKKDASASN